MPRGAVCTACAHRRFLLRAGLFRVSLRPRLAHLRTCTACSGGAGLGPPAPRAPHLTAALQTTHPERGAFLDDRGQLGETDVHGEVPGLPGERTEHALWASLTGPTAGPRTAHSSGCAHGSCIWANAEGSGDRTTWLAACRSLVCGTFSNAVSAGRHLPTPMPTLMPTPMHSRGRTMAADVAPNARVRSGSFVRNGPVWGQEKGVCPWTPCPESPSLRPGAPPHSPPRASDLCPTRSPRGRGRWHLSGWRG